VYVGLLVCDDRPTGNYCSDFYYRTIWNRRKIDQDDFELPLY